MVRNARPGKRGRDVFVGCDAEGIGAALSFRIEERGSFVMLEVMAVDLRLANRRIGDEMMETFIEIVTQRVLETGRKSFTVQAKVDHRNERSLKFVKRWGFTYRWTDGPYLVYEGQHPLGYVEPPPT